MVNSRKHVLWTLLKLQKEGKMKPALGRKKLWQIASCYHCAIVGTCLGRRELRQIKKKKNFNFEAGATDFEVHSRLSGYGDVKNEQSRMLHKFLDTRYAAAVKRYAAVTTEEELLADWEEDCQAGKTSGAFWAVMTHPLATAEVQAKVYGDCHLLSFEYFSNQRNSRGEIRKLEESLKKEGKKTSSLEQRLNREIEKCSELRLKLAEENERFVQLETEFRQLQSEKDTIKQQFEQQVEQQQVEQQQQVEEKEPISPQLKGEQDESALELEIQLLRQELQEAKEEIFYYRSTLQPVNGGELLHDVDTGRCAATVPDDSCHGCGEDGVDCPGCEECSAGLCGKMILYVGGHHKMVSRYRELVEKRGGRFAHHDGGRENSRQRLPQLLSGADVVLCPVDCVSHDACKRVKKICKRYCKPFRMMRSSGVSALEKELEAVV